MMSKPCLESAVQALAAGLERRRARFLGGRLVLSVPELLMAAAVLAGALAFAAAAASSRWMVVLPVPGASCLKGVEFHAGLVDRWARPEKGGLVAFKSRGIPFRRDGMIWGKYYAAAPLDSYEVSQEETVIEGRRAAAGLYAAMVFKQDPAIFERRGVVDFGQALVMGTSVDSYDSRYWGPVGDDQIEGVFIPLF